MVINNVDAVGGCPCGGGHGLNLGLHPLVILLGDAVHTVFVYKEVVNLRHDSVKAFDDLVNISIRDGGVL